MPLNFEHYFETVSPKDMRADLIAKLFRKVIAANEKREGNA